MDLLDLIRNQIKTLPAGVHLTGLQSVLNHIETAYKHFSRGQSDADESAFTDTIYRTNQAFEGSAKEAYRVLTERDPQKLRPYDIEKYLEEKKVFRDRVLLQFTNYRTEWRNPSTHDYNLRFDEAEAFLAIVSVSAFVKLLVDEIAERLSYLAVQRDVAAQDRPHPVDLNSSKPLVDRATAALRDFAKYYSTINASVPIESEAQLMGALSGYLSSILEGVQTTTGRIIRAEKSFYVDMMISSGNERIVVELKRGQHRALFEQGVVQVMSYLEAANAKHGILFLYSNKHNDYDVETLDGRHPDEEIRVIRPSPI